MLYLKSAKLSGYKTIKNTEVEFRPGLNIIIGKNAVGKTNFFSFLKELLHFNFREIYQDFNSELILDGSSKVKIIASRGDLMIHELGKKTLKQKKLNYELWINGALIADDLDPHLDTEEVLLQFDVLLESIFVHHGVPSELPIMSSPWSSPTLSEVFKYSHAEDIPSFSKSLIFSFFVFKRYLGEDTFKVKSDIVRVLQKVLFPIHEHLKQLTPISEVRVSDDFRIAKSESALKYGIGNLYLEYNIEGQWLTFSQLSDGIKRLVYLVSEVTAIGVLNYTATTIFPMNDKSYERTVLIEEPELGIHPHQLHKLMLFLKQQAESKQIILTTHSPQVLDILGPDELDRIIIAKHDKVKGTTMHHLSKQQMAKARKYMKEDFLSDYWRFSDLED